MTPVGESPFFLIRPSGPASGAGWYRLQEFLRDPPLESVTNALERNEYLNKSNKVNKKNTTVDGSEIRRKRTSWYG